MSAQCGSSSVEEEVGKGSELRATVAAVTAGMESGLHFGAQVYASVDGVTVCDLALGVEGPGGPPLSRSTILPWFSSIKPALGILLGVAIDRGYVRSWRDRVSTYVPEFGVRGKGGLTFEDLLTHVSGLVCAGAVEASRGDPWDDVLTATCEAEPEWTPPGAKCGYSMGGAYHVVATALQRVFPDATSYGRLLKREVFLPLGVDDASRAASATPKGDALSGSSALSRARQRGPGSARPGRSQRPNAIISLPRKRLSPEEEETVGVFLRSLARPPR